MVLPWREMPRTVVLALPLAALAAATLVAYGLRSWLAIDNPSSVYLLAVAGVALASGTTPALATAVGAFLLYNFLFLDPRFTLEVADPQAFLTLLLLLAIGLIVGRLTGLGRDRAADSARRAREARALFAISRALAITPRADDALGAVAERITAETEMERVWIGLGATAGRERLVADTEQGTELPASAQSAVLRRDLGEEDAKWTRVHRPSPLKAVASPGEIFRVELTDGEERLGTLYAISGQRNGDPSIETSRLLAVAADQISQALRRDRLARRALDVEVAERSDEAKSALLDLVSHDLRTPLAAIRASAGSLADRSLRLSDDERQALAEAIDVEAMRLNRLVSNLLDMTRLQAGRVTADIEVIPVEDAIDAVVDRVRPTLGARVIETTVPALMPPVLADALFLDQVLTNLIDNADRHSPTTAMLRIGARQHDDAIVELVVEDGGVGVPDDELPRIFERFYRANARRSRSGAGLGLALVRGLVEAMDGSVSAERSSLGGLAVIVRLRAAPPRPGDGRE